MRAEETTITVASHHGMAVNDRLVFFRPRPWWRRLWSWVRARCGRPERLETFVVREVISNTKLIVQRVEELP